MFPEPAGATESIESFPVLHLYFGRFLLLISFAKRLLFQHVNYPQVN